MIPLESDQQIEADLIQSTRFMGLNDLMSEIRQDPTSFTGDEGIENKVLNQVLTLVEDKISEVKNQAVKWYALDVAFVVIRLLDAIVFKPGPVDQNLEATADGTRSGQAD